MRKNLTSLNQLARVVGPCSPPPLYPSSLRIHTDWSARHASPHFLHLWFPQFPCSRATLVNQAPRLVNEQFCPFPVPVENRDCLFGRSRESFRWLMREWMSLFMSLGHHDRWWHWLGSDADMLPSLRALLMKVLALPQTAPAAPSVQPPGKSEEFWKRLRYIKEAVTCL
jgi:hypothetical protein